MFASTLVHVKYKEYYCSMKKIVSIIGGGPAALMCAAFLDPDKFEVTIYEKNKTVGRKFLVAGKGGFNLSHSESVINMITRYTPALFLEEALLAFDNKHLRDWLLALNIPTYIGSSKRIYPEKGIKPIEVLNSILTCLQKKKVQIKHQYNWSGWEADTLVFNSDVRVVSDLVVFALGGKSWAKTGSDGSWLETFNSRGVLVKPFQVSNCAFGVNWGQEFIEKHQGSPLKNITISCLDKCQKGEVVLTRFGLEGNAVYALSPQIRDLFNKSNKAFVFIDLKPRVSASALLGKFQNSACKKTTDILKKDLNMSSVQVALVKYYVSKEVFMNPTLLVEQIKNLKIDLTSCAPIQEGISTVGGIALDALDSNFELKNRKDTYCIGEMIDWDAPTGGYLLQACFSMGVALARSLNNS